MIFYPGQGISSDMIKEWAGPHPQKSKDLALETWTALAPFPIVFQRNSPLKNDSHKGRQRWRKPFEMYLFFSLEAEENFFPLRLWKLLKVVRERFWTLLFYRMNIKQTVSTEGILLGAHSHPELGFHDFNHKRKAWGPLGPGWSLKNKGAKALMTLHNTAWRGVSEWAGR